MCSHQERCVGGGTSCLCSRAFSKKQRGAARAALRCSPLCPLDWAQAAHVLLECCAFL